jgi:hypothetical protein
MVRPAVVDARQPLRRARFSAGTVTAYALRVLDRGGDCFSVPEPDG